MPGGRRLRNVGCGVAGLHGEEGDPKVSDLGEQPVQLRLVCEDAADTCGAVAVMGQGEVAEPRRPVLVQVTGDPNPVLTGSAPLAERCHGDPTSAFTVTLLV